MPVEDRNSSLRISDLSMVTLDGISIHILTMSQAIDVIINELDAHKGGWVITPNLDHLRRARHDISFRAMLANADLVVADGMPLIWASRLKGTPLPERVAGSTMVNHLAEAASLHNRSIFLLGGEADAAQQASSILLQKHPKLNIVGTYSPPFGFENDPQ